jgi:hypothetical protein
VHIWIISYQSLNLQEKELVAEGIERSWAELKLKGMLKWSFWSFSNH